MRVDWNTRASQKRYWCDMKKISWLILYVVLYGLSATAQATEIYSVTGNFLSISENGRSRMCRLSEPARYAVESNDKSALLLSERGYVPIKSLVNCSATMPIHVYSIPDRVGVLTDVNLTSGIYISLDFVSVQPFLYLANVARLGSSKNLVTLKGSYTRGRRLAELRKYAFGGAGDAGSSNISPDGHFVAPTGDIDCRDDAYPGVWDIARNKRVITDDDSCSALFEVKGNK